MGGVRLKYVLVSDGSSDRMLFPALEWLICSLMGESHRPVELHPYHADFALSPKRPRNLAERISEACRIYEPDILFIHRDAEVRDGLISRIAEVEAAIPDTIAPCCSFVPVVPVRMTEAWLLIDERAIRDAASNPSGRAKLKLPKVRALERIADPKLLLEKALVAASEASGKRRRRLNLSEMKYRVASLISSFSPLRQLTAFQQLEKSLRAVLTIKVGAC